MVIDWVHPKACVKCGENLALGYRETWDSRLWRHLLNVHRDAVGIASAENRAPLLFVYVRPVYYRHERAWYVIVKVGGDNGSLQLVEFRPAEWSIEWLVTDKPSRDRTTVQA